MTRVFGAFPALVRADLRVEPGEVILVRGPNGAGKSTLLRVIATALSPTYGTGSVLGHDLVGGREQIRWRVELLGHRTRLYDDLTASENLRFACSLFGLDRRRVAWALERVGLSAFSDEPVRGYSQGMRQRAAVARVLLRSPEILLLDEPYTGLDVEAKLLVDEIVADSEARGCTVLLATHDLSRAGLATREVFMEAGRVRSEPFP